MQPALVVGALAVAVLLESSELGRKEEGRDRALMLRDMAHTYLVTAWNAGSTDPALAQAAMVSRMTIFNSIFPTPYRVATHFSRFSVAPKAWC